MRVSEQILQTSFNVAATSSPTASYACVDTWHEDFRKDLAKVNIPTLVLHGDSDRIVPLSAQRTAKMIPGAQLVVVKNGPHPIIWTHSDEVNPALLRFLKEQKQLLTAPA